MPAMCGAGQEMSDGIDLDQGRGILSNEFRSKIFIKLDITPTEERIEGWIRSNIMKDRRKKERRNASLASPVVVMDPKGRKKTLDRRRIPDRRLNNIGVEFIPLDVYYNS